MNDRDISQQLQDAVRSAAAEGRALHIRGGGSKAFYGRDADRAGEPLDLSGHRGIISYTATELVISARCGTPLAELEAALAERDQVLPFEPPHFDADASTTATVGGALACGLSGPRRPWGGALRDHVLGTRLLNGRGEPLRFGGEVIKNVAGYDVSRLLTGSLGVLGAVLEVSFKVLPAAAREVTLAQPCDAAEALRRAARWSRQPLPLSGIAWDDGQLRLRLAGAAAGVTAAVAQLRAADGGEEVDGNWWQALREQQLAFFAGEAPLWRLSLPPASAPLDQLPGDWLLDWGGAQRWLRSEAPAESIRAAAAALGGHATLFRGGERSGEVFHPLDPVKARLHRSIKAAFDPKGIFNPGKLYADL